MLGSRMLHPEALGRVTENGNRVGEFTVDGTIELVLFGGLGGGVAAAVIWVIVWQWVPRHPLAVGLGAVAIGGFNLIDAENRDFVILVDPLADVVLLVGLLFAFGASLVWIDRWFDTLLPDGTGVISIVVYSIIVSLGVPFLIPVIGGFFTTEFCFCANPPLATGGFVVITALATGWWWVMDLRGSASPPRMLTTVGATSVALAIVAGTVHLVGEITTIL